MESDSDFDDEYAERKKKLRSIQERELEEDDVLMDPEAIAEAKRAAAERKLKQKKTRRTKPVEPRSAFHFYRQEMEDQILEEDPELDGVALTNALTLRWNEVSVPDRAPFDQKEAEDKTRYEVEMAAWNELQEEKKKKLEEKKKEKSKKRLTRREEGENAAPPEIDEEEGSSEDLPLGLIAKVAFLFPPSVGVFLPPFFLVRVKNQEN